MHEISWLTCYMDWLKLRQISRADKDFPEDDIRKLLIRLDQFLTIDILPAIRVQISQCLMPALLNLPKGVELHRITANLADALGRQLSDPNTPLSKPRIQSGIFKKLTKLALRIDQHEHGPGDDLTVTQISLRGAVSREIACNVVASMLANGIAYLPVNDEAPFDAFRITDYTLADEALFDIDLSSDNESESEFLHKDKMNANKRNVFIIHGRDRQRNQFFFDLLRRVDLHPLEFEELIAKAGSGSPYIGDIVRSAFDQAQAVIALFTGDDLVHIRPEHGDHEEPTPQPRPNVLFEAGMAIALQRDRTVIVEVPPLRGLSDLHGIHAVRFNSGSAVERNALINRLKSAGCEPNTGGTDWLDLTFPTLPP